MVKKLITELNFGEEVFLYSSNIKNKKIKQKNEIKIFNRSNDYTEIDSEDFNYKYSNDNFYYKGEIALWKAVILQAMIDLQSNSRKKIANTYRIKALMWFNLRNEDFLLTCSYAGLDPKYVHEKAMKVKEKSLFFN